MFFVFGGGGDTMEPFFECRAGRILLRAAPFSLLGAWRLLKQERRIFMFIFLLLAGCIAYTVNYSINDIDSYFLLAYVSLAMFAGFGALEAGMIFKKVGGGLPLQ